MRRSSAVVDVLLADDFTEFASTGEAYAKSEIIAALRDEHPKRYTLSDFEARALSSDIVLTTFRLSKHLPGKKKPVESLRCSVWKRSDGRWRMTFHQGTLCSGRRAIPTKKVE